jgi:precorrin-4 methylase
MIGKAYLIGAGPGRADRITVRGRCLMWQAANANEGNTAEVTLL